MQFFIECIKNIGISYIVSVAFAIIFLIATFAFSCFWICKKVPLPEEQKVISIVIIISIIITSIAIGIGASTIVAEIYQSSLT